MSNNFNKVPCISKKTFVDTLKAIQKERKRIEKFNDALDKVVDGYPVLRIGNGYLESLTNVLNEIFGEQDEEYPMIDWWLFEHVKKEIYITSQNEDGTKSTETIDVSTPELFYDYLCQKMLDN